MSKSVVTTLAQILLNVQAEAIAAAHQKLIAERKKTEEIKPLGPQLKKNTKRQTKPRRNSLR